MNDKENPEARGASDASGSAGASGRVPSFDELMGFGVPTEEEPTPAPTAAQNTHGGGDQVGDADAEEYRSIFSTPAAPTPAAENVGSWSENDWSAANGASQDEVPPLVLPGFSPEPQRSEPLPPVFRTEKPASEAPVADDIELPPTQPVPTVSEPVAAAARTEVSVDTAPYEPPTDTDDVFAALGLSSDDSDEQPESAPAPKPARESGFSAGAAAAGAAAAAASAGPAASAPVSAARASQPAPAVRSTASAPQPPATPVASQRSTPQTAAPTAAASARAFESEGDYEKISVTGGDTTRRKLLPWIIVGGGVLVAIIASILVINSLSGSSEPEPTPQPSPTTTQPTPSPEPSPTETEDPEPTTPEPDSVPVVEVGPVFTIPITQWGLDVEKPQRLGSLSYSNLNDQSLTLEIELAQSLPESCAAARNGWGLAKAADGTLEVVRPTPRCADADAAAVYDTIWGLVDHMAKSAKPIS